MLAQPISNRPLERSTASRLFAFALLALALLAGPALGGQVTLTWDANTDSQLGGYKLYYGQSRGTYIQAVDVGKQTTYILDGLKPGQTYYFAVTAYGSQGQEESAFSSEAQATVPAADPAPAANFTATQSSGRKALNVAFTDTSTGKITVWSWYFGDGATSASRNPRHTYSLPGVYSVKLTVKGPGGTHTMVKTLLTLPGRKARLSQTAILGER